jgi:dTDP-4-amino-4,6-dideoxygalactose transaminase
MTVPFVDLKRDMAPFRAKIQRDVETALFEETDYVLGQALTEFENEFASYIGVRHCIGVANGTDALEIAIQSLNLPSDSEILTQANTYVATCFGISRNGHNIGLVDIEPNTYQLDLDLLEQRISPQTRAVIVVHLYGASCDMVRLMDIIQKHKLVLIEDCAQSHGAYFGERRLGTFGQLSTFSFYPGKNLGACGDGGAVCCDNATLCEHVRMIRNNGGVIKYQHKVLGRNSRLDTVQAVILRTKLSYLDEYNSRRRKLAQLYHELLKDCKGVQLPCIQSNCLPVYHLFVIRTVWRDELLSHLRKHRIGVGIHYPNPIHMLPCFDSWFTAPSFPNAERNSRTILSLPMFATLTEEEVRSVCAEIVEFLSEV